MGSQTMRYHKDHPDGLVFDTDELPSEVDGWFDSPKLGVKGSDTPKPVEGAISSEFPDAKTFANVRVFVAAVDPLIPALLVGDERGASGLTDEELDELDKSSISKRRRALLYYASRKYSKDLAKNGSPEKLFDKCMALDAGGDPE